MFVIFLKFCENEKNAGQFMDAHNAWIKAGIQDGIFLVVGSLKPNLGGAILTNNCTYEELSKRLTQDPFVAEKVVTSEVFEIDAKLANEKMSFLVSNDST